MGFVGNYAPCGLSPQMYDMPVILKKRRCDSGAGSASVGRWRDAHDTLRKNIICHNGGASRREICALSGPWHYVV